MIKTLQRIKTSIRPKTDSSQQETFAEEEHHFILGDVQNNAVFKMI